MCLAPRGTGVTQRIFCLSLLNDTSFPPGEDRNVPLFRTARAVGNYYFSRENNPVHTVREGKRWPLLGLGAHTRQVPTKSPALSSLYCPCPVLFLLTEAPIWLSSEELSSTQESKQKPLDE